MTSLLRTSLLALSLSVAAACSQRQVEVRTAPTTSSTAEPSATITNSLSQAVTVYVTTPARGEIFLRQIPANTVEKVPVPGVQAGTSVQFKAVTVDGSRTYQSRNAPLSGTYVWSVP
jgi:ABC-type glycerol-3-phosphate transport system substrate-binding protein